MSDQVPPESEPAETPESVPAASGPAPAEPDSSRPTEHASAKPADESVDLPLKAASSPAEPEPEEIPLAAGPPDYVGWKPNRRGLLAGAAAIAAAAAGYGAWRNREPEHDPVAFLGDEGKTTTEVFVGKAPAYDDETLTRVITEGLEELGVTREFVRGKNVLLKPNFVAPDRTSVHANTHPLMLVAAAEAFRSLDAKAVAVAESQADRRDPWMVLEDSGILAALDAANLPYTDLNHDDLYDLENAGGLTGLPRIVLPLTLQWADLLVSMPKLKTHHWAGCTLSMKNLFGVLPGIHYGWPKNVLHQCGIEQSIIDINQTVPFDLAIVDGVVGMEGDGPILGTPKAANVVVMGRSLPSVDATCARIMKLHVPAIRYLLEASARRLGPVRARHIEQVGEDLADVLSDFAILDAPHLQRYKPRAG